MSFRCGRTVSLVAEKATRTTICLSAANTTMRLAITRAEGGTSAAGVWVEGNVVQPRAQVMNAAGRIRRPRSGVKPILSTRLYARTSSAQRFSRSYESTQHRCAAEKKLGRRSPGRLKKNPITRLTTRRRACDSLDHASRRRFRIVLWPVVSAVVG